MAQIRGAAEVGGGAAPGRKQLDAAPMRVRGSASQASLRPRKPQMYLSLGGQEQAAEGSPYTHKLGLLTPSSATAQEPATDGLGSGPLQTASPGVESAAGSRDGHRRPALTTHQGLGTHGLAPWPCPCLRWPDALGSCKVRCLETRGGSHVSQWGDLASGVFMGGRKQALFIPLAGVHPFHRAILTAGRGSSK